jgi:hypothetical protein
MSTFEVVGLRERNLARRNRSFRKIVLGAFRTQIERYALSHAYISIDNSMMIGTPHLQQTKTYKGTKCRNMRVSSIQLSKRSNPYPRTAFAYKQWERAKTDTNEITHHGTANLISSHVASAVACRMITFCPASTASMICCLLVGLTSHSFMPHLRSSIRRSGQAHGTPRHKHLLVQST